MQDFVKQERQAHPMTSAHEALKRLREGNERFASEVHTGERFLHRMRRAKTNFEQKPFAIVLGCSDSRVPVEIVFDQDLGDLFVIRVAGNIAAPSQLGSIEFAAAEFGTPLVVVMGHTHCGAILGTLEQLRRPTEARSPHLRFIADRIRPAVADLLAPELGYDRETLIRKSVQANVRQSVDQLRHGSKILERLIDAGQLHVVGAEYSLETGRVEFFDALPDPESAPQHSPND
ncbi:carbonic anhydrase [Variovorax sp. J22P271]|uniref:carbonic anhydrase n=1 Tax=Variovorax davisae TaxID=3053515 RepID=UPI00257780E8|nr:carbonic anhydrase [Variovorax sp. J22P271]MDM0037023.1 carbonic anhydrase [Variovorax sp. J22P271]